MNWRAILLAGGLTHALWAQAPVCRPIETDRILARDLAAAAPVFSALPPETLLAASPQPGAQRSFHPAELQALAERYGIRLEAEASVCFERAMEPLNRDRVLAAMRAALPVPDARIELSENSLYPVPRGRIEFPLARLGTPATQDQRAPVLWRGDVIYGEGQRFAIWARVRIIAMRRVIVAAENLKPGHLIEPSQLREAVEEGFPALKPQPAIDQLAGMLPIRPIAAGTALTPEMVSRPNDVNRGDLLEVEVRSGAARLILTGRAESGGRDGDSIAVRNPESNRIFTARVAGKGKAVVLADPGKVQ